MQLEGDDRADARAADGRVDRAEFLQIETRRLFEQEVLAGARRRRRLRGVEVVRRRDRDDLDVAGGQQIGVSRGEPGAGRPFDSGALEPFARAAFVPAAQIDDACVRVRLERGQVLGRHPADSDDSDPECRASHRPPVRESVPEHDADGGVPVAQLDVAK